ncbi:hypothetical protein PISMIDRAFT_636934, partial [Pisolithus microcarpus 441]
MYTQLCHEMMETINPKVQDDGIKNAEGKPITGGQLFCRYLLHRCQEDFERGWVAEEAMACAAAAKASGDKVIKGRWATRASHILTSTMWLRRRNVRVSVSSSSLASCSSFRCSLNVSCTNVSRSCLVIWRVPRRKS